MKKTLNWIIGLDSYMCTVLAGCIDEHYGRIAIPLLPI